MGPWVMEFNYKQCRQCVFLCLVFVDGWESSVTLEGFVRKAFTKTLEPQVEYLLCRPQEVNKGIRGGWDRQERYPSARSRSASDPGSSSRKVVWLECRLHLHHGGANIIVALFAFVWLWGRRTAPHAVGVPVCWLQSPLFSLSSRGLFVHAARARVR